MESSSVILQKTVHCQGECLLYSMCLALCVLVIHCNDWSTSSGAAQLDHASFNKATGRRFTKGFSQRQRKQLYQD